jgi:hypothetical protein
MCTQQLDQIGSLRSSPEPRHCTSGRLTLFLPSWSSCCYSQTSSLLLLCLACLQLALLLLVRKVSDGERAQALRKRAQDCLMAPQCWQHQVTLAARS